MGKIERPVQLFYQSSIDESAIWSKVKPILKEAYAVAVQTANERGAKLKPDDITIRRLTRIFRVQIKKYLETNTECRPYLYHKYGDGDSKYRTICYSGAEHLCTAEEGAYLLRCYGRLDAQLEKMNKQHGFVERIKRVLIA